MATHGLCFVQYVQIRVYMCETLIETLNHILITLCDGGVLNWYVANHDHLR